MKNLLTFVSPTNYFNEECDKLVKIQIENSFDMGWRPEDIVLATNFDYEYMGVHSLRVADSAYCDFFAPATKVGVIVALFKAGLIEEGQMYWYHDFDTHQLSPITEEELGMDGYDLGITNYGRMPRLCSASMFFKKGAEDIFDRVLELVNSSKRNEENCLMRVLRAIGGKRVLKLNITYAFHRFNLRSCYRIVDKPIRAAHFHLTPDKIDFYVRGINSLNMVLLPDSLISILTKYGYR